MTIQRACRNSLVVVRTMAMSVVYVSMAIAAAGVARAVWLIIATAVDRAGRV